MKKNITLLVLLFITIPMFAGKQDVQPTNQEISLQLISDGLDESIACLRIDKNYFSAQGFQGEVDFKSTNQLLMVRSIACHLDKLAEHNNYTKNMVVIKEWIQKNKQETITQSTYPNDAVVNAYNALPKKLTKKDTLEIVVPMIILQAKPTTQEIINDPGFAKTAKELFTKYCSLIKCEDKQ